MGKHTKGPWRSFYDRIISTKTNVQLATVHSPCAYDPESREQYANASLIAAAPELLEALKDLVACNENWNAAVQEIIGRQAGWNAGYLNRAKSAILKAEPQ